MRLVREYHPKTYSPGVKPFCDILQAVDKQHDPTEYVSDGVEALPVRLNLSLGSKTGHEH